MSAVAEPLVVAVPKGRILDEALPIIRAAGIVPEADFGDESSRKLRFATNHPHISLIRVRSFEAAAGAILWVAVTLALGMGSRRRDQPVARLGGRTSSSASSTPPLAS